MASSTLKTSIYPLFAAVGVAAGICGFQLVRNICINPEVRVNKECWITMRKERNMRSIISENSSGTETLRSCQQLTVSLLIRKQSEEFQADSAQSD
ncbi:hypothetical protein OPV22_014547 [Ensete ventricosum]|uniref:Uncharacterized protein n=1 Tax=Ensete ventricosum TaxID=4639 RepID=A0AAV8RC50_ENSVE|nr:hypothetical protein OPV22_014547 [Ensete ventricosum]